MKAITQDYFEFFHCQFDWETHYLTASAGYKNVNATNELCTDIKLNEHAIYRMDQRGISFKSLALVLLLGERIHKQHGCFYFFGKDSADEHFINDVQLMDKTKNIAVWVVNDDEVVTLYKNKDAFKAIKKKSKRLSKYQFEPWLYFDEKDYN